MHKISILLIVAFGVLGLTPAHAFLVAGSLEVQTTTDDESIAKEAVVFRWRGAVAPPMARDFQEAFDKIKASKTRMILDISSPGGSTAEGAIVISFLREVKKTHELTTVVQRGELCASMCVPVYLQGQKRIAARTSSWMFHGARPWWTTVPDKTETDKNLIFFRDAGVSEKWINDILPYMREPGEYWQTGGELIDADSKIILQALANHRKLPVQTMPIDHYLVGPK